MRVKKAGADWETSPLALLWKSEDPLKMNKFRERETQRVYDFIEKSRAFHAAQEPRYEA